MLVFVADSFQLPTTIEIW